MSEAQMVERTTRSVVFERKSLDDDYKSENRQCWGRLRREIEFGRPIDHWADKLSNYTVTGSGNCPEFNQ